MKKTVLMLAGCLGFAALAAGTAHVTVDFDRPNGTIRAINGGNLGPDFHAGRLRGDGVADFRQLRVPSTRLHDVPLATRGQRVVDTHFIFPLQHLDPKDPRNYYFKATDDYLQVLRRIGTEPYFRLGTSIEHAVGSYNAVMPEDFEKFAEVCCGIIRHYNKGWANGFEWDIKYWEVWNEPDIGKPMWNGSMQDYCRLYEVVSKKIKAEFPEVKVGGPVICRFHPTEKNPGKPDDVGHVFMRYCRDHGCPLDFFAWHRYDSALPGILGEPAQMRKFVDAYGYTKTELILDEWHYWVGGFSPAAYSASKDGLAGVNAAVFAPAVLTGWQDSPLTMGHHYTIGPLSGYWGAWSQTGDAKTRFKLFYTLRYFAKMLDHPNRVAVTSDQLNVQVLAGKAANGRRAVLVSNFKSGMDRIELALKGAPNTRFRRLVTDPDRDEARDAVWTDADGKLVLKGVPAGLSSCICLVESAAEEETCDFASRTGVAEEQPMAGADRAPKAVVKADFTKRTGPVKPMHGVGQPPQTGWGYQMFHYLKEAGIPYSRLHDVGGHHGKDAYVDIPNLFRDFDADENDPASYDFAFTDLLLKALVAQGVEPYFRLGITIENRVDVKHYRTIPPKDFAKWARICEHVVRHYTEGWANGFTWKITYWEIWNEADNHPDPNQNPMWKDTFDRYIDLYDVTAKHLKKCFPHLKIGGFGSCGFYAAANSPAVKAANSSPRTQYFVDCYLKFLDEVKKRGTPMDFFSFHTYSDEKEALRQIRWGVETLKARGFTDVETHVNEWLPHVNHDNLGSALQASAVCAEMIGMQHSQLDAAMIYDGRCGVGNYSPLFNPLTYKPHKAYYALKAFNEAYRLKHAVATETSHSDVYALAAGDAKGGVLLVANTSKDAVPFRPDLGRLNAVSCILTDDAHTYEEAGVPDALPPHSFLLLKVGAAQP